MLFWPLSAARFESPVKLFYGLHWSDGLVSVKHIWTLLNELAFALIAVLATYFLERRMVDFKSTRRLLNRSPKSLPEES
jgi:peptidoglycan/LPS O-acetylase OafA/YrhL